MQQLFTSKILSLGGTHRNNGEQIFAHSHGIDMETHWESPETSEARLFSLASQYDC